MIVCLFLSFLCLFLFFVGDGVGVACVPINSGSLFCFVFCCCWLYVCFGCHAVCQHLNGLFELFHALVFLSIDVEVDSVMLYILYR